MDNEFRQIYDNIMQIREKIDKLNIKSTENIKLLAATKMQSIEKINFAIEQCGISLVGENRASELKEKAPDMALPRGSIHFIGHLQTNKIKTVLQHASCIQSVGSLHLAEEIDKEAEKMGIKADILIEINSGKEENKSGIFPENIQGFIEGVKAFDSLCPKGIMTMAPKLQAEDEYLPYFSLTREIFENIFKKEFPNVENPILSMGMSDSFIPALKCGANLIRLGSAIFGKRM